MPKTATRNRATPPAPTPSAAPVSKRVSYARSAETRAKILAAALAEASEAGFHRTSVARIAARAGVAVGNLHYHFGSRGELLRVLMGSLMNDLMQRLQIAVPDPAMNFFDVERAGLLVYIQYLRDNPAYGRLLDEIKLHEPELFDRGLAAWIDLTAKRMRAEVARGNLRPMDDDELWVQAHLLLGSRHFLAHMTDPGAGRPYPGDDAIVDAYLGLVRAGLGPATTGRDGEGR